MTPFRAMCAVLSVLLSVSCSSAKCGPATCPSGCCDAAGACQAGTTISACGTAATACSACAFSEVCTSGSCRAPGETGGGTASSGGGSSDMGGGNANTGGGTAVGGGAAGGGTSSTGGGTTSGQLYTDLINALCQRPVDCGTISAAGAAQCQQLYAAGLHALKIGISAGQIAINTANATACVAAVRNAPCNSLRGITVPMTDPGCSTMFQGLVRPGNHCDSSEACGDGYSCAGATCTAVCAAKGTLNHPCRNGFNTACDTGLWCDREPPTYAGLCRAPGTAGSSCQTFVTGSCGPDYTCSGLPETCVRLPTIGQNCLSTRKCDSVSYCQSVLINSTCITRKNSGSACASAEECGFSTVCRNRVCQSPLTRDQPCTASSECASGMACDSVLRTCQPYRDVDAGLPCTDDAIDCNGTSCRNALVNADGGVGTLGVCGELVQGDRCTSHYPCPAGTYCSGDFANPGQCTAAGLSTPCNDDNNCRLAEYCSTVTRTCAARIATGQVCPASAHDSSARSCAVAGDVCSFGSGSSMELRCHPPGALTDACVYDEDCGFALSCVNRVCVASGATGTGCIANSLCTSGGCEPSPDGGPKRCAAPRPEGKACTYNNDCATGFCDKVNGVCAAVCL